MEAARLGDREINEEGEALGLREQTAQLRSVTCPQIQASQRLQLEHRRHTHGTLKAGWGHGQATLAH